jgi:trimethylamine:corrinoid methyltransferase-like protein
MKAVGHGGTFLTSPHTGKNFRKELYIVDSTKRGLHSIPPSKVAEEAREVVRKTLREHTVPGLDRDIVRRGDEIVKKFEKSLGK